MGAEYRVTGPPGVGKTEWIRRQVEKYVHEGQYNAEDIVLTSFTRASAAVLAGRIPVPRQNIATLHALAYRALGSPPLAETGDLADEWNQAHAHRPSWQVAGGITSEDDGLAVPDSEQGEMLRLYDLARHRMVPQEHPLYNLTRDFRAAWDAYKDEKGAIDFCEMISLGEVSVPALQQPVLLVDEAQDLTPLQWSLARQWGASAEVFIVSGDPAQVLFGFAGSRPDEFLSPLPPERSRLLGQSYRLPRAVQARAERTLSRHSGPMMVGREYLPREAEGVVRDMGATWRHPEEIVDDIERQLRDPEWTGMVLTTCAFMLTPVVAALRERGIAFHNPYRRSQGAWNPLARVEGRKSTASMVAAFAAGLPHGEWIDLLRADTFIIRGAKQLLADGSPEPVEGLIKPEYRDRFLARDLDWLRSRMLLKYTVPAEYAIQVAKAGGPDRLREVPRVVVGTGHSVKGGEARTVYALPDVSLAGSIEMNNTREGADAAVRLQYVMETRASEELVLCSAADPRRALW